MKATLNKRVPTGSTFPIIDSYSSIYIFIIEHINHIINDSLKLIKTNRRQVNEFMEIL